jgi:integrase/recombinase XerC
MELSEAIDRYVRSILAERNLAPRTGAAYRYDLERMALFLRGTDPAARTPIASIDTYRLKDYLAFLKEEHDLKPTTLGRTISAIRMFFQHAREAGWIAEDPAARLRTPKKPRRLPIYLLPTETRELVQAAPSATTKPTDPLRNETILHLLMMTGLRLSELVGLDVDRIDLESGFIRVLGKGRKERLVPLNSTARGLLTRWLAERPSPVDPQEKAAFLGRNGARITRAVVQYVVKQSVKGSGLDPRISPHKLRHTFATTLYSQGVELRDIQTLLGHANIASTAVYTHTNVDRVRAAVAKLRVR